MNSGFLKRCDYFVFIYLLLATLVAEAGSIPDDMVAIPAGVIKWSGKDISVSKFYMDKYETIQQSYKMITGKNPSYFKGSTRPVEKINWFEADKYCLRLRKRLPTEWEWERAAQLGNKSKFSIKIAESYGWFKGNSELMTHPVGQKKKNLYGLYDMTGNVWEWTSSDHESGGKVMRGGSWRNSANSMRPSKRITSLPHYRYHYVGFRCVVSIELKTKFRSVRTKYANRH